jgi:hypothetical protein
VHDYSDCYATLGVTPDTDWKTLRASYKRLMGRWHPDRFSADAARKEAAEERCKRITIAYQELEKYRRAHGVLPLTEAASSIPNTRSQNRNPDTGTDRASSDRVATAAQQTFDKVPARRKPEHGRLIAIGFVALIAALYLAYRHDNLSRDENEAADRDAAPAAQSPSDTGGIAIGMTLGEVYAVQGVPTLAQGDTWHYGKSQVRFAQGKVISWKEDPDNPLRIARDQSMPSRERHFNVGSTMEEVRAIQGAPVSETDTVWDYAPSLVYFEHNRVVRWVESPAQPLRVPR